MLLEDLPDVPPAVPLLLAEVNDAPVRSYAELRTRFTRILPELRSQSEWYLSHVPDPIEREPSGKLDIYVDGGMDLFDDQMSCPSLECRVEGARRFCRSVGLLGDTIWLTDHLTSELVDIQRLTDAKLSKLINHTIVLRELEPFIAAGIVRFKPGPKPLCLSCGAEFERQIEKIADHLVQLFASEFDIQEVTEKVSMLSTGGLCYPPMNVLPRNPATEADGAAFTNAAWYFIKDVVRSVIWTAHQASPKGGSVFSNSKVGLAALAYRDGAAVDAHDLRLLEDSGHMTLPWVNQLSPAQVVQLRSEADKAFPAFRESLSKALEASSKKPEAVHDTIAFLREQAVEVRGELESTRQHAGRFWKTGFTTLGFGACAYGAVTGNIPLAVGGLLPLMQLMVSHKAGTEKDIDKLKRRPGYVLVKAQDIFAHAH